MFRVFCVSVAVAMCGCAFEAPKPIPVRTKIVTVEKPVKVVTVEKPIVVEKTCTERHVPENVCATHKTCGEIRSCGEAFYRLTVCKDGGLDADNDSIPCEAGPCDRSSSRMAALIRAAPFTPAARMEKVCQ